MNKICAYLTSISNGMDKIVYKGNELWRLPRTMLILGFGALILYYCSEGTTPIKLLQENEGAFVATLIIGSMLVGYQLGSMVNELYLRMRKPRDPNLHQRNRLGLLWEDKGFARFARIPFFAFFIFFYIGLSAGGNNIIEYLRTNRATLNGTLAASSALVAYQIGNFLREVETRKEVPEALPPAPPSQNQNTSTAPIPYESQNARN